MPALRSLFTVGSIVAPHKFWYIIVNSATRIEMLCVASISASLAKQSVTTVLPAGHLRIEHTKPQAPQFYQIIAEAPQVNGLYWCGGGAPDAKEYDEAESLQIIQTCIMKSLRHTSVAKRSEHSVHQFDRQRRRCES